MDDFNRCKKKVILHDALWVKRIKESCVLKNLWFCPECECQFSKMLSVTNHSVTCPKCKCRLVLDYKNKYYER
jgi:uncharacterized paraquat-inducible protein A